MEELFFKVKAGLKNIIGRDLITDDNIAIFELVKNSYDAHAQNVVITFEDNKVTIADNGKGMSYGDITTKWLAVAYSAKQDGTEDNGDEVLDINDKRASYRDNIHNRRFYAGAKGIGRFSCDRLGCKLLLTTKKDGAKSFEQIKIDWTKFDSDSTEGFEQIPVEYKSVETPNTIFPHNSSHGTILEISDAHNWDRSAILSLKHSLEKLINPFSDTNDFNIEIVSTRDLEDDNRETRDRDKVNGEIRNQILDILNRKTTQIEIVVKDDKISSKLYDRGALIYHIEEHNKYNPFIDDLKIDLYFLNRSAKINFSKRMGVASVNYGSVFLFKNGFRVQPYGDQGDDSWGIDFRAQQGYNRYLASRNLLGRVDIFTENIGQFNEVSSRDGGLKKTAGYIQLQDVFWNTGLRRLERYVVGVLWGEAFLKNRYFKTNDEAQKFREALLNDKDSEDFSVAKNNLGSKIDFIRLIKSLADDKDIRIVDYNKDLVDIVNDNLEDTDEKFITDLRKIAEATGDGELWDNIGLTERAFQDLRLAKEQAEEAARLEIKKREAAERQVIEESRKRVAAEEKSIQEGELRVYAERERDIERDKNKYLSSTRNLTPEVEDLLHTIKISSVEMSSAYKAVIELSKEMPVGSRIREEMDLIKFHLERINKLSSLLTKADINVFKEHKTTDIPTYIKEYLQNYSSSLSIEFACDVSDPYMRKIPLLDLSVILDNLVSNSKKAQADKMLIEFKRDEGKLFVDFSDDGIGVDSKLSANNALFEIGVTNRRGGSGIGLHTIRETMQKELHGDIMFLGNNRSPCSGATFRLIF